MKNRSFPTKRIFIIDELSLIVAFFLALKIRYGNLFFTWKNIYDGLYVSFLFVIILLQVIIYLSYDKRNKSVLIMDPFENLVSVLKSRFILLVLALMYLYITQRGELSSRFVIAAWISLNFIFDYVSRMVFRKLYLSENNVNTTNRALEIWDCNIDAEVVINDYNKGNYDCLLLHGDEKEDILEKIRDYGIRIYTDIRNQDYLIREGIISYVNGYASILLCAEKNRFSLFGVNYAVTRPEEAVYYVMRNEANLRGEYICFSNVHTLVMAREDANYRRVLNSAAFTFADGKPIAMLQQKRIDTESRRVAGPDFMDHMFKNTQDGKLSHFFYGSTPETLDALKLKLESKYPGIIIKGMYSPPFRELSTEEDIIDVDTINSSGADIIWIGLGAPKQEKWMNMHKGKINGIMMGVGAGFDFHAGTIKRAPKWMQKIGLEWLYRLSQDPERLFKRYLVTNTKFIWYLFIQRLFGKEDIGGESER